MITAGIDIGAHGAIALIDWTTMRVLSNTFDNDRPHIVVRQIISGIDVSLTVIEKVHAFPGQGSCSMFAFGKQAGLIVATLDLHALPYQEVTPQAWKKHVLSGTSRDKTDAIKYVQRRFPQVNLVPTRCRNAHDGLADAICMAVFARNLQTGCYEHATTLAESAKNRAGRIKSSEVVPTVGQNTNNSL